MRVAEQPEHDVPPGVHVVRDHQQLAESGLTKVLEQQIDVVAPELVAWRRRDGRRAANQAPQLVAGRSSNDDEDSGDPSSRQTCPCRMRRRAGARQERKRERTASAPTAPRAGTARRGAESPSGSAVGSNRASSQRRIGRAEGGGDTVRLTDQNSSPMSRRRPHPRTGPAASPAARSRPRPPRRRRAAAAPPVGAARSRLAPQAAGIPQPRAAVDRRKQRADRADAAAGDEIDPDARLVQRAQHARVVGAGRADAGQHERGPKARGIVAIRGIGSDHRRPALASFVVDGHELRRPRTGARRRSASSR